MNRILSQPNMVRSESSVITSWARVMVAVVVVVVVRAATRDFGFSPFSTKMFQKTSHFTKF